MEAARIESQEQSPNSAMQLDFGGGWGLRVEFDNAQCTESATHPGAERISIGQEGDVNYRDRSI
jgi:hypothetical protein